MTPQIEPSIERIASGARARYRHFLDAARSRSGQAATRVGRSKRPLHALSGLGIKLSGVSHRATAGLLKQQTKLLEHQLDALALRLNQAAGAASLGEFVRSQLALVPQQFDRLASDARASLDVVLQAGSEARTVVGGTLRDLRGSRPAAAPRRATPKAARRQSARRKATTRKATTGKATAPKAAAGTGRKAARGGARATKATATPRGTQANAPA